MKVYIVTSGTYSDYGIAEVFTDETQARLYCATHNNNNYYYFDYRVEEYEADTVKTEGKLYYGIVYSLPPQYSPYSEFGECFYSTEPVEPKEEIFENGTVRITRPVNRYYKDYSDELLKVCRDLYAQYMAEKEGL